MTITQHDIEANRRRARALPIYARGEIPPDKNLSVDDDTSGFINVVLLFLRSWPYIRPQLLGRWFVPGKGIENRIADTFMAEGYSAHYAIVLYWIVLVLEILVFEVISGGGSDYGYIWFLYQIAAAITGVCLIGMQILHGRNRIFSTVGLIAGNVTIIALSFYVIDGWVDGVYTVTLNLLCITGWMYQVRVINGRIDYRIRLHAHLVYYYGVQFIQRFLGVAFGLVNADLLNQAILQGEPLAPGLARILGYDELNINNIAELSQAQRMDIWWFWLMFNLGFHLINFPINIFNGWYNMWIQQRINQDLRVALVERWHLLSMSYHSEHRTGDSIFRIYQDSSQVTVVIGHIINLVISLMSYFSCVGLISLLSPWLGLAVLVLTAPAIALSAYAMPRVRVRSLVYRARSSDVTSTVQESFSSIRLIKAFTNTRKAQDKLESDSVVAFNAAFRVRELIALVTILMFTLAATFMITGEFFMAWWAYNEEPTHAVDLIAMVGISFTVWNLAAFNWAQGEYRGAANNIRGLLRNWMTAQDMAMGLRRVFDILDLEPDIKDKANAIEFTELKEEIRFDNVKFHYEEDRPVLDGVNLVAKPGSITAIIGPTGSGKSTLLNLLLRLYDPQAGDISIDNINLKDYQTLSVRSHISIALQENVLFAMSVRDNIRYATPNVTDNQILEAVRIAAMDDYVSGLPKGLDTVLSDRGGKLSSGQKQRLTLARAIIRDTPILILDEPTAALDAVTEHKVMRNLAEWGGARAIFLVTHRISTIRQADNIIFLEEGRIRESGSHEELMAREGGFYRGFVEKELHLTSVDEALADRPTQE